MKYLYIFILNSVLFTIGWFSGYYYELQKLDVKEEDGVIQYYRDSRDKIITPWDKLTDKQMREKKEKL